MKLHKSVSNLNEANILITHLEDHGFDPETVEVDGNLFVVIEDLDTASIAWVSALMDSKALNISS
jgi:predicted negative regulator of RcsB-dependent stress response